MTIKEFAEQIQKDLQEAISVAAEFSVKEVEKNNISLTGIAIRPEDSEQGVLIYLNDYFEDYENGRNREEIVDMLIDNAKDAFEELAEASPASLLEDLHSWEACKDKITAIVVGTEDNRVHSTRLSTPAAEDLAFIYYMELNENLKMPITESILSLWEDVDIDTLHQAAMENTARLHPPFIQSLSDKIQGIMPEIEFECSMQMIVVSNTDEHLGAVSLFNADVQDELMDMCDGDFYVLPSSMHEVLVIPGREITDPHFLSEMVKEVNETEVNPEDRLAGHAYGFDSDTGELVHADQFFESKKRVITFDSLRRDESEKREREKGKDPVQQGQDLSNNNEKNRL